MNHLLFHNILYLITYLISSQHPKLATKKILCRDNQKTAKELTFLKKYRKMQERQTKNCKTQKGTGNTRMLRFL